MSRRILHLDLDAFFASVEQRDKPSLRGKPVIVGGIGGRGVVATASYEARRFGVHSAMSTAVARRLAPHAAYLAGRFDAYRESSDIVMRLLREISPEVEPLSLDEAFVDISELTIVDLDRFVAWVRAEVQRRTSGLTASVGVGSSKFIAKLASEEAKPDGAFVIADGAELDFITPLPVQVIPGVGSATLDKLHQLGISTVADLQQASVKELVRQVGESHGTALHHLAFARDDRVVESSRERKSISMEDTFAVDLTDMRQIHAIVERDSAEVARRLRERGLFARTVTFKVRFADFTTWTRSRTLEGAIDQGSRIAAIARSLLEDIDIRDGIRLLGVGVSEFATSAQDELFGVDENAGEVQTEVEYVPSMRRRHGSRDAWVTGMDVVHDEHGRGWVWGAGTSVVTVRFESRDTAPGSVRSFDVHDPALRPADPLPL